MGNTVARCGLPVVSVHHDDGRVSHFMAPVSVADLLEDHPDYFVVTITNGRKNILTPSLELQHGGIYHIIPPPLLFTSMDSLQNTLCGCSCCAGCSHLPQVLATYFASSTSLRSGINNNPHPTFNSKLQFAIKREDVDDDPKKADVDPISDRPSLGALLGWIPPEAENDNMTSGSKMIWSPRRSSVSRYSYEKVKKDVDTSRRSSFSSTKLIPFNNNKNCRSKSDSSPRSSFERLRSLSFPKEKWLEDMIRGAETQWKRVQQDLAVRGAKNHQGGAAAVNHNNAKGWTCTWWVLPRRSSVSKKDEIMAVQTHDPFNSLASSPARPATVSKNAHVVECDERLSTSVRPSLERDESQDSMAKKSMRELWLEIEKLEYLEQQEQDLHNKQSLRLRIGEVERQIMRSSSVRNAFQLCVGGGF